MTQRTRTRDLLRESFEPLPRRDVPPCDTPSFGYTGRIVFDSFDEFPTKGCIKTLYFSNDNHTLYFWDATQEIYLPVVSTRSERLHIDGGGAADAAS